MAKKRMNLGERVLNIFSPESAERRYVQRVQNERAAPKMVTNTGYGNHGASQTKNAFAAWNAGGGSAEEDIDLNAAELRKRARDLYAGGGLGRSGPATMTGSVAAWGIQPKPKIDGAVLGMTDEECDEWERKTLREFRLWAENVFCDSERSKNFYTIQNVALRSTLVSGDVFALIEMKKNPRTPYMTTVRLLEADRVSTPDSIGDSTSTETENGGRIVDGIEIDRNGEVTKYHIANRHPLADGGGILEWKAIDAFGKKTGMPNVLHYMLHERPEQRRGVPMVAPEMELIKQLDRFVNAEMVANVVSSYLTAFVVSEADDGMLGLESPVPEEDRVSKDEFHFDLAPGSVIDMPPGKKIEQFNPLRVNSAFKDYVLANETLVGAGLGIPVEVLTKKYASNYTASRGAKLDFWNEVRIYRNSFNRDFNQPLYEAWLSEAVALGRIDAPGFFDDPIVRQAWCGCTWMGASMGHIDPLKEVNAAAMRIALNISTQEQEAAEYNGGDWMTNVRQRLKEIALFGNPDAPKAEQQEEEEDDAEE